MKNKASNYYHYTLKGIWYFLKGMSKALFFFSLGLIFGFLLFLFDKIQTKDDVKDYILLSLVLVPLSLFIWLIARKLYYSKVEKAHRNEINELLERLQNGNEISTTTFEREKARYS